MTTQNAAPAESNTFTLSAKTVYVLTHFRSDEASAGVETLAEFESLDKAERVAKALHAATPGSELKRM